MSSNNITVEIVKHIGVLSERENGWTKELNIVAWNGGKPKLDIREWSTDHARMSKGLVLTDEEAKELRNLLNDMVI